MGGLPREEGLSLIGLLLTVAIIGVVLVLSLQTYKPVLQSFETGGGSAASFKLDISRAQMQKLYQMELLYYTLHRSYATWDQLVADGQIAQGYTNRAQGRGTPFIPYFDIDIQVSPNGFVITATPSFAAGAPPGTPVLKIDQEGNLVEVPSK